MINMEHVPWVECLTTSSVVAGIVPYKTWAGAQRRDINW